MAIDRGYITFHLNGESGYGRIIYNWNKPYAHFKLAGKSIYLRDMFKQAFST